MTRENTSIRERLKLRRNRTRRVNCPNRDIQVARVMSCMEPRI